MTNSEKLHEVTLSRERLNEIIKRELYSLGYGRKASEYISHVEFGALQEDESIPVHFWTTESEGGKEEYIEYK